MQPTARATRIRLFDISSPPMRAFHMTWFAFFLCFFAWFGIAPLMSVVRDEMSLTKDQIGWCIIGSVAITIVARLLIGWLCDRIGPRIAYTWLLILGSIPVMCIGLANDFSSFLICRVLIGAIGASFVITQYHTSAMFAPTCVGTANATAAGWGNLGGGVTQMVMPYIFAFFVGTVGLTAAAGWRASMLAAGVLCLLTGVAYYFLTQDTPEGNFAELRANGQMPGKKSTKGAFAAAARDRRVWVLFVIYGCCFGLELTLDNILALYFADHFTYFRSLSEEDALKLAGLLAGLFGGMNLFARAMGGIIADKVGNKWGLSGRVKWLFLAVFCEGLALMLFSQMRALVWAVPAMILMALFVKMSNGATYAVVPFINKRALGSVAGIVGAGGNAGAVLAGFLFKSETISWPTALFILGAIVTCCSFSALAVNFSEEAETDARMTIEVARGTSAMQLEPEAVGA